MPTAQKEVTVSSSIRNVSINFPEEGLCTGCEVEDLDGNKYLLRKHPLMAESVQYGDLIEAMAESPDQTRFIRVIEGSKVTMHEYIPSKDIIAPASWCWRHSL
ncbi:hypothetical protein [Gynuella sp.]|uniref:hypothetical protein n=1 Tax=Gynuella sp. TaxID=2969146 RepID=UPI003D0F645E